MIGIRPSRFVPSGHNSRRFTHGGFSGRPIWQVSPITFWLPTVMTIAWCRRAIPTTWRVAFRMRRCGSTQTLDTAASSSSTTGSSAKRSNFWGHEAQRHSERLTRKENAMTTLAGQTALVTGANRGMGREYIGQLLDRGVVKVYAAARDPRSIDATDPAR